jgi:stearoyl-CoA desaturase (delta-9 desaturase)
MSLALQPLPDSEAVASIEASPDVHPAAVTETDGVWASPALDWITHALYWGVHAAALGVLFVTATPIAIALLAATFFARMLGITAGYHRYFAHRSYRTSRAFQFLLALLGTCATQKGPLWWASLHRIHHRESDGPNDVHSPKRGLWYAHQGWIFDKRWQPTRLDMIPDFARYPEIEWLNRWHFVPPVALAVACFLVGGWPGLFWGFFLSTTLLWHATYTINSLSHVFGGRRFATTDTSRNNWALALLTLGEGWHNNHHFYMASARQGFRWFEVDVTYYVLRALAAVGLIWDVREPPRWMKATGATTAPSAERRAA